MFDIGWSEIAVIAVVALVVLGPKELPNALRQLASWIKYARKMAGELQSGFNELVREAELDEARKTMSAISRGDIGGTLANHLDPTGEIKDALVKPSQEETPKA